MLTRLFSLTLAFSLTAHAIEPKDIFKDAAAVWHLDDLAASSGITMKADGAVKVGVELKGKEWDESLARGGDGKVAVFEGGVLTELIGEKGSLSIAGDAMTVLLRVRGGGEAWKSGEVFARHGGHEVTLFNLHVNKGELGFEFGVQEKKGLAGRLAVPLESITKVGWHDVIARYNGAKLMLFVDGVAAGSVKVTGHLRSENKQPFTLGKAMRGQVDHAAVWTRALSDAEGRR